MPKEFECTTQRDKQGRTYRSIVETWDRIRDDRRKMIQTVAKKPHGETPADAHWDVSYDLLHPHSFAECISAARVGLAPLISRPFR